MKKQRKQALWQSWLQNILSPDEYIVFQYFSHYKTVDKANPALAMRSAERRQLFESSMEKIKCYMETYTAIVDEARIHVYTKQKFLQAPISELGLSTRTYQLLNDSDLKTMQDVINLGVDGLQRIRGFGNRSLIELKTLLKYKGCEKLN